MNISKVKTVALRDAFPHEAHKFTTWLEKNIDALAESLKLSLTVTAREKSVGSFHVDLECEDEDGNIVIVENQLEKTDHRHLGQLLTYLVNLQAKAAIWIVSEAQSEHQRVIDWLNSTGLASFYLVRVQAIQIENSPYAPLFSVMAAPDEQTRQIGETKKEIAERHYKRKEFWTGLIERSKGKTSLFANIKPGYHSYIQSGSGKSGVRFRYLILRNRAEVDVYIDVGEKEKNNAIFDFLHQNKQLIDADFGDALEWRRLDDDRRACRIVKVISGKGGLYDEANWSDLQDVMIESMIKLVKAVRPRVEQLPK